MNRKLQTALFVALTSMFSLHLCAQTPVKAHSFGGHIATGGIEFNDSEDDGDGVVQIYGFYNYAFTKYFALEVGLNVGADVDEWDCYEDRHDDWHCSTNNRSLFGLGVDEVEYSNLVTAIKGVAPISQRNSLYAKVGAQFYEYELSDGSQILHDDDGTGLYLAVGWQYVWDMGIGMNTGFERYNMGDLVSTAANIGISYSF